MNPEDVVFIYNTADNVTTMCDRKTGETLGLLPGLVEARGVTIRQTDEAAPALINANYACAIILQELAKINLYYDEGFYESRLEVSPDLRLVSFIYSMISGRGVSLIEKPLLVARSKLDDLLKRLDMTVSDLVAGEITIDDDLMVPVADPREYQTAKTIDQRSDYPATTTADTLNVAMTCVNKGGNES